MAKRLLLSAIMTISIFTTSMAQVIMRYGPEIDFGWGDASSVVTPYVTFPAKFTAPYAENNITHVKIGLCQPASNCYLYIKENPNDDENLYRQKIGELEAGWNDITLTTPFPIEANQPISIGYKASFASKGGVGVSAEKWSEASTIYNNSQTSWVSVSGSICIQAYVEGDNMPINEIMVGKLSNYIAEYEDTEVEFALPIRNVGVNTINRYEYELTYDDNTEISEIEATIAPNQSGTIKFSVPTIEPGTHHVSVKIVKANDESDFYEANNLASCELMVKDPRFIRRVVCEEYTGTWCGWCPRGLVGLEQMKQEYPDRFIAISIHGDDPLAIDSECDYSYSEFISNVEGAPYCKLDRVMGGDPYYDIHSLFNIESAKENNLSYNLTAIWNSDKTQIDLISTYQTNKDISSPSWNIAFSITEDGITGYPQINYYAGGQNGTLYGWEDKSNPTYDVVFDDLARAIIGGYRGMEFRHEDIVAYETYEEKHTINLPDNVLEKENIYVIGQIIDNTTGEILNAMRIKPAESDDSAVISRLEHPEYDLMTAEGKAKIYGPADQDVIVESYNTLGIKIDRSTLDSGVAILQLNSGINIIMIREPNKNPIIYKTISK